MRGVVLASLLLVLARCASADGPVYFADPKLKEIVEAWLFVSEPTPQDMLGLPTLYANGAGIGDLTGLEYAANLESLDCAWGHLTSVAPLAGLSHLKWLELNTNQIHDLSPLSGLTGLEHLNIHDNGIQDISPFSSLTNVSWLDLHANSISDLSALSGMTHLEELHLEGNAIKDISPLSGLTSLRVLRLATNRIDDLTPLAGLSNLRTLRLSSNRISDLSPLAGLSSLEYLILSGNEIGDIAALASLTSLRELDLANNPLSSSACTIYIPQIAANNPGIYLQYNPCTGWYLSVSATAGGTVTSPGEGRFGYEHGAAVRLEAQATSGFVFAGFSGTYNSADNPTFVTMNQDHIIQANFVSTLAIIRVDDDAPGDFGPRNPAISDPWENGTREHPFDRIQEAIDVAPAGAKVFVHAGAYRETLSLLGKRIELTGFDPEHPYGAGWPVIDGGGIGPAVSFINGEDANCLLTGFVLSGGKTRSAPAIRCHGGSPTISHCLIVGNLATDPDGAVLSCTDSRAAFVNCTIADNHAGTLGAALVLRNSPVSLTNSILWGNTPAQILVVGADQSVVRYGIIASGWPGTNTLAVDPLFAAPGRWSDPADAGVALHPDDPRAVWRIGDYHLQSQTGRWDPQTTMWLSDKMNSPAIDAGDPTLPIGPEPVPNGAVINLGVYGGTAEASKSRTAGGPL